MNAGDAHYVPITQGARIKSMKAGPLIFTETTHTPGLRLAEHRHERANLVLVMRGSFLELSGPDCHQCRAGSILIKPAGVPHSDHYGKAGATCLIVEMEQIFLRSMQVPLGILDRINHRYGGFDSALASRIYREFRIMDGASILAIEGLILELLSQTLRARETDDRSRQPLWLKKAKELIEGSYREAIHLQNIAREVGIHPAHLAKKFRDSYGCSVGDYVRALRLEYALHQLTHSNKSATEIALEAGFYDQSHFIHLVKKQTGQTPSQITRMLKQNKSGTTKQ